MIAGRTQRKTLPKEKRQAKPGKKAPAIGSRVALPDGNVGVLVKVKPNGRFVVKVSRVHEKSLGERMRRYEKMHDERMRIMAKRMHYRPVTPGEESQEARLLVDLRLLSRQPWVARVSNIESVDAKKARVIKEARKTQRVFPKQRKALGRARN